MKIMILINFIEIIQKEVFLLKTIPYENNIKFKTHLRCSAVNGLVFAAILAHIQVGQKVYKVKLIWRDP